MVVLVLHFRWFVNLLQFRCFVVVLDCDYFWVYDLGFGCDFGLTLGVCYRTLGWV